MNYTNKELARDYYRVAAAYCERLEAYNSLRRKIAESGIDLPAFYREHGNFDGLKIKGIGKITKEILYLILEKGVNEAVEIIKERRADEQRKLLETGRRGGIADSRPPLSWDDVIKRYEGD